MSRERPTTGGFAARPSAADRWVKSAAPPPAKMPEALTIFLQAQEKERVLRGLRATARDLRAGLLQWAAMWEEGQDRA